MESLIPIQDEEDFDTLIPSVPDDVESSKAQEEASKSEEKIDKEIKKEVEAKVEAKEELKDSQNNDILSQLESKVDEIVSRYHNSSDENEELRAKITLLQTQNEVQTKQIDSLEGELKIKDFKIEEILNKLNSLSS
jgi:chromosome segregation ATPase